MPVPHLLKILWLKLRLALHFLGQRAGFDRLLLQAACIGILGGLGSSFFKAFEIDIRWLSEQNCEDLVTYAKSLPPVTRLLVPTLGGLIAGSFLWVSQKILRNARSVDYLEAIRLWEGHIPARATFARLLSSLASITTGASIGREGGMVQLSATTASLFGRLMKEGGIRLRLMVACGAAAGISASYNTPLAGPLFIAEVVIGSLSFDALAPLIIASVSAAVVSSYWLGMKPLFDIPPFAVAVQIPVINALYIGLIGGLCAPLFRKLLEGFKGAFARLHCPLPFRLGAGGLMVGVLSLWMPEV